VLPPERRAAFETGARGGFGAIMVIDDAKRRWIKSYTAACDGNQTAEKRERQRCLLAERDMLATTLERMSKAPRVDMRELGLLSIGIIRCDPDATKDWSNDFDRDQLDFEVPVVPDVDVKVELPKPPAPPPPPPPVRP
jgi:hypothetical protein